MAGDAASAKDNLCSVIRAERMLLRSSMTLPQCRAIADYLYSKNALISSEMECIKVEKTATSAAGMLLDNIEKKGSFKAGIFIEALRQRDVGLDFLADKLMAKAGVKSGDSIDCVEVAAAAAPLTDLKRKFRRLRPTLITALSEETAVLHVVDVLYAAEKLSEGEKQMIECQQTPMLKSRRLIDSLDKREDEALSTFLEALKSDGVKRPDLAQQIMEEKLE